MEIAVSVIVPVFNGGEVIERCLKSITEQTLSDIEIIVVDDGSADNTASVVRSFCDERIILISQENTGQGFARNAGLCRAKGKYTAFVDADDTIERDMLFKMVSRAEETGADMVQCNICDIFPDGRRTVQLRSIDETVEIADRAGYIDRYFSQCRHSYEVCNKLIRRGLIEEKNMRFCDTKKYFSEDLMFNLCLLKHLKTVSFISEPYYNYYQHENSHFRSDAEKRMTGVYSLFRDYISKSDEELACAVSYTASMITLYNIGFCPDTDNARDILCDAFFKDCIKNALRCHCSVKHRMFLTAVYISPLKIKLKLAEKYSGRWRN